MWISLAIFLLKPYNWNAIVESMHWFYKFTIFLSNDNGTISTLFLFLGFLLCFKSILWLLYGLIYGTGTYIICLNTNKKAQYCILNSIATDVI